MHGLALDSAVASLFAVAGVLVGPFLLIRYQLTWPAQTAEQRAEAERIAWKYGRPLGLLQAACAAMVVAMVWSRDITSSDLLATLEAQEGGLEFPRWSIGAAAALALLVCVLSWGVQVEGAEFMRRCGLSDEDVEHNLGVRTMRGMTSGFRGRWGGQSLTSGLLILPFLVGFLAMGLWAVLPPY